MSKKVTRIGALIGWSTLLNGGLLTLSGWAFEPVVDTAPPVPPALEQFAQNRTTPPVPPLPMPVPTSRIPSAEGIEGIIPEAVTDVGVGHLRPKDLSFLDSTDDASRSRLAAGWLQAAAVPIYIEPNGAHWGWIVNGWLVPNGQTPIAIGEDATFLMVQAQPNLLSFPVIQMREDGWFQFQYTSAGNAWAHVDHLNLGTLDLAIESWENRFVDAGRVEFRQHGLSQSLYSVPNATVDSILGLIGPNSLIQPLAFEGDWMRVQVTQPADDCIGLPGAATQEGWMRWRSEEQRSLVWFASTGCENDSDPAPLSAE